VKNKTTEILIIAYYFPPDNRVGALRTDYWYKNLPHLMPCRTIVITANSQAQGDGIHFVPPTGKSFLGKFIKDAGLFWIDDLKKYLLSHPEIKPDLVIISGGPFMHFGITKWLKKHLSTKVILDYRDPFATNPGFRNSFFKRFMKLFFERRFNKQADALVTVNKYCSSIISSFNSKPNAVVQNGFDESEIVNLTPVKLSDKLNLVYAGKFYFSPEFLISAVEESGNLLNYLGPDEEQLKSKSVIKKGFLPYAEAIQEIAQSDVGVIQTYGEDFQSTTKLFDYIRCKKPILVISNLHIQRGSIHDELSGYPNVFWASNTASSIQEVLSAIKVHTYIEPPEHFASKFSRRNQALQLITLIDRLLCKN
jgi:hypothetical protein